MSSDNIAKNRQKSAGFVLKNPEKFDGFHEVPQNPAFVWRSVLFFTLCS